jgi:quercetin dioxygenase-like cupin family protein
MTSSEQKFCLSRAQDADFVPLTGYRDWLKIRDLGLSEATNGQHFAHVTRANELGGTTGPHYHEVDFQILYVLKGWVKFEYEEEGEVTLNVGDFVYHPPRMVHNLVDYSPDVELFELLSPAQYATIDL